MNIDEILDNIEELLDRSWSLPLSGGRAARPDTFSSKEGNPAELMRMTPPSRFFTAARMSHPMAATMTLP